MLDAEGILLKTTINGFPKNILKHQHENPQPFIARDLIFEFDFSITRVIYHIANKSNSLTLMVYNDNRYIWLNRVPVNDDEIAQIGDKPLLHVFRAR